MKIFFTIFFSLIALKLHAQMPADIMPGVERGQMKASIYQDSNKENILKDHTVALVVFQNDQRILMLDKKTDQNGVVEFGNIFKENGFTYALGVLLDNKLYVRSNLELKLGQDLLEIDFPVGEGSPYEMQAPNSDPSQSMSPGVSGSSTLDPSMPPPSQSNTSAMTVGGPFKHNYQKMALILSFLIIFAALGVALKKKKV